MTINNKIDELKIILPDAKAPVGSYVATKIVGKLLYISGQISVDENGKLLVLTAALVCIPDSPKINDIKSDAPFITLGCSIKSSVELTKPVNFTHDLTLDKSPLHAFFT